MVGARGERLRTVVAFLTNDFCSFGAVAGWSSPRRGSVSPNAFTPTSTTARSGAGTPGRPPTRPQVILISTERDAATFGARSGRSLGRVVSRSRPVAPRPPVAPSRRSWWPHGGHRRPACSRSRAGEAALPGYGRRRRLAHYRRDVSGHAAEAGRGILDRRRVGRDRLDVRQARGRRRSADRYRSHLVMLVAPEFPPPKRYADFSTTIGCQPWCPEQRSTFVS